MFFPIWQQKLSRRASEGSPFLTAFLRPIASLLFIPQRTSADSEICVVPLSGGIDSCATAVIVFSMTRLVYAAMVDDNKQVIEDARRICGEPRDSKWMPSKPEELCNKVFHTWCAMATVFSYAYKLTESLFLASWARKIVVKKRELGLNSLQIVLNRTLAN